MALETEQSLQNHKLNVQNSDTYWGGRDHVIKETYEHNIPEYNGLCQVSRFHLLSHLVRQQTAAPFNWETWVFLVLEKPLCHLPPGAQLQSA